MKNPFKRKQCKQCGWELKLFSKMELCGNECHSIYRKNEKEYEGSRK